MITTLDYLKDGNSAAIHNIHGGREVRRRLNHLGIHPGDHIEVVQSGYFGGPVVIKIHGTKVGIGHGMATKIEVEFKP